MLDRQATAQERAFLLGHDTDPVNRWEAGRALAKDAVAAMISEDAAPPADWLDGVDRVLRDEALDPAFRALCLRLPSDDDMAQALYAAGQVADPDRIRAALDAARTAMAQHCQSALADVYERLADDGPFSADAASAGRRALRLGSLALLSRTDGGARAAALFPGAKTMTETISALAALLDAGRGQPEADSFHAKWKGNRLVIDKWFSILVMAGDPAVAADTAVRLARRDDFDWKNPNRFRALLGGLGANHAGFHRKDGAGYRFYADWLIRLDPVNPQTTARMSTAFDSWRRYDAQRQSLMRSELGRIAATPGLSRDTSEMVGRILG